MPQDLHSSQQLDQPWLIPLTEAFSLGDPESVERLQAGLIQQTWRLRTHTGIYICQKLHAVFDEGVTADGQAISTYLRSQGFSTPRYLTTQTGSLHLHWQDQLWRVMESLPGCSHQTAPQPWYLEQAGYAVGQLHQLLSTFEYEFQFQIPHFHDTVAIWQTLQDQPVTPAVESEARFLLETVPQLFLPSDLPRHIIHGDLKFNNFLFGPEGSFVGLVDLDTFMWHSLYVELADALRSWATVGRQFSVEAWQISLSGYGRSGYLRNLKPGLILQGLKLITLELSMRFLNDYFEDRYFDWEPTRYPSRQAHNLDRCRKQIAVYQDILRQEDQLQTMLDRVYADLT
jgi:Ser/Thr protein kinase RdoA (MazF antagonist)